MKKISLNSSAIAGGATFSFTKEANVFGYHLPYMNAKAFKKTLDDVYKTAFIAGPIAAVFKTTFDAKDKDGLDVFKFAGAAFTVACIKGACEDFLIDRSYQALGLDLE